MTNEDKKIFEEISKLNLFNAEEIKNFILKHSDILQGEIVTDKSSNIFTAKEDIKKLIIFDFSPIGVSATNIIDERIYLDTIGLKDGKRLNGKKTSIGVIKKEKNKIYIENCDKNLELLYKNYNVIEESICEGDLLYGLQLQAYIPLFLLVKLISMDTHSVNAFNFTLVNKTLSSDCGYIEIIKRLMPEELIFISVCCDKDALKNDIGPAIVIKDGNGVTKEDVYSKIRNIAIENNIPHQFFIGKKDKAYEKISVSKQNMDFCAIYIPTEKLSNGIDKVVYDDVEKTLKLLLKCIYNM